MKYIDSILAAEPAVFINLVVAGAAVAAVFGVQIEDAALNQAKDAIVTGLALLGAVFGTRRSVFSPKTHMADVATAYQAGLRDSLPD